MEVSFPETSDLEVFDDWRMTDLSTIDQAESHDVNRQSVTDDVILKRMNSEELMDCMCVEVASLNEGGGVIHSELDGGESSEPADCGSGNRGFDECEDEWVGCDCRVSGRFDGDGSGGLDGG